MKPIYPFKFLNAYTQEDKNIFFGRDEEIQQLYDMSFQSNLLLVYGESGTGKSSLIQCGLANRFEKHERFEIQIRRGKNLPDALWNALEKNAGDTEEDNSGLDWLEDILGEGEAATQTTTSVGDLCKRIHLRYFRPIYLIFDQFEELYILGSAEEQQKFITQVKEILQSGKPIKIIISIREEYLGYLYEFEKQVPQLMQKKMRIESMRIGKVQQVIAGINQIPHAIISIPKHEQEAFAEAIFHKLKTKQHAHTIQLPYLQVFLDKLYTNITQDHQRETAAELTLEGLIKMGDIGDVLTDFLNQQVREITQKLQQPTEEQIWEVLSPFVTLEGTKEPTTQQTITEKLPHLSPAFIQETIQALAERRILRPLDEEKLFEIAHDSLAKRIAEKRSDEQIAILEVQRLVKTQTLATEDVREYFTEKQLNFIEPYLTKFAPTAQENAWIDASEQHVQKLKAEAQTKHAQALQEAQERAEIERKLNKISAQRAVFSMIAAGIAVLLAIGSLYAFSLAAADKAKAETATVSAKKAEEAAQKSLGAFKQEKANAYLTNAKNMRNLKEYEIAHAYLDSAYKYQPKNLEIKKLRDELPTK